MKKLSLRIDVALEHINAAIMAGYDALRAFIESAQKDRGFIRIERGAGDIMYALVWLDHDYSYVEYEIKALRVKDGRVQMIYDPINIDWSINDIVNADDDCWRDLMDDMVHFRPTLIGILDVMAELIED